MCISYLNQAHIVLIKTALTRKAGGFRSRPSQYPYNVDLLLNSIVTQLILAYHTIHSHNTAFHK